MKFQNTNAVAELNFSVLGKSYKVEPGGEVDIDPAHVPYVLRRGIQLAPATFKPKAKVVEAPKPEHKQKPKTDHKPIEPAKPTA